MDKYFDFSTKEKTLYDFWLGLGLFSSDYDSAGIAKNSSSSSSKTSHNSPPFTIVLPPPNVTGRLHMGHALNCMIQDALMRTHMMNGEDTLWIPGTDHAGIATQTVVKKMLDSKGIDYRSLGREKFISHVFEWKEKYGSFILDQIKSLGCSCDWERTRFTMDEQLSLSVTHAFKRLYEEGLIYKGERIVNWCPIDQTALSDDEVETAMGGEEGYMYDIAYPVIGGGEIVVSTTRPETMFGDTGLAVHPQDQRYMQYIGKKAIVPLMEREIEIFADEYVDKTFGTGALKVTPAHDKNDFEIGKRHNLEIVNVMNLDATLNENVPERFRGLSRENARNSVIKELEAAGQLKKKNKRMIPKGRSYRSKAVVEQRLSMQWFVKMEPLAKKLLARIDDLEFYPSQMKKVFVYWLENIQDWCISRQIWWGHRIPVWTNVKDKNQVLVGEKVPDEVLRAPNDWHQEEDVLDTWFSSALWPMSTLGWPNETPDFQRYFPTSVLSTAKDIIFFWVARMCLFSLHFENKLPFTKVNIHPTIVDQHGKTMSKSKGNGIDPQHIINGASKEDLKRPILDARPTNADKMLTEIDEQFEGGFDGVGCDALRYTLLQLFSSSQMMKIGMKDFSEIGGRFVTKIWNAARFSKLHIEKTKDLETLPSDFNPQNIVNEMPDLLWMDRQLDRAENKIALAIKNFDFAKIGPDIYKMAWSDLCDWYIEFIKVRYKLANDEVATFLSFHLAKTFIRVLVILHPYIPFVTEEIYREISGLFRKKTSLKLLDEDFFQAVVTNDSLIQFAIIWKKKICRSVSASRKV